MPRDYSTCCIYRIVCRDTSISDCYVGHTIDFKQRKHSHKISSIADNKYIYRFIRKHGGFDNFDIVKIEDYPCVNQLQARARERYWIDAYKATLNTAKLYYTPGEDTPNPYCIPGKDTPEQSDKYDDTPTDAIPKTKPQRSINVNSVLRPLFIRPYSSIYSVFQTYNDFSAPHFL